MQASRQISFARSTWPHLKQVKNVYIAYNNSNVRHESTNIYIEKSLNRLYVFG